MPRIKNPNKVGSRVTKIPAGLLDEVERFARTKEARKLGLNSNADVVGEAVREFLRKYGFLS